MMLVCLPASAKKQAKNNIAIIDMQAVYQNSTLIQSASSDIAFAEENLKNLVETAQAELAKFEEKHSDKNSLAQKQKEIQDAVDKAVAQFNSRKEAHEKEILERINSLINRIAKEKSYSLILDKGFVADGGEDITEYFQSQLENNSTKKK